VAGMPTTAGARAWTHEARGDAASVGALRAAGAIVLGKAATNEWAYGIDGRNPWRVPCRNPHDPERLPGGSSSGPAVAIAAGLALGGVGTDTSGSLRVPAALCGIASLRPTPGRVPLDGVLSLAPSYDVVGPMGATAADVALLLAAMAGPAPAPTAAPGAAPPRVGLIANLTDPAQPEVAARVRAAGAALHADEIELPELDDALDVHASVQLYEAARVHRARGGPLSNLAPEVAARIEAGSWIDDAAYLAARARRAEIARAILAALARYDVLLAPTVPIVAPLRDDGDMRTELLSCVVPLTQAPVPVASVPLAGPGLPIGAQLVGRPGADEALLEVAARLA
jgi:Asp-tRNA(Asn)/Glu-tRNA(Gln) amidotransferase A subunit family amidase